MFVRNPFDNIADVGGRSKHTLEEASRQYFGLCRTVQRDLTEGAHGSVIDVRHEALTHDSKGCLRSLCSALGLTASETYLDACAAVVAPSPHLSRREVPWTAELIGSVEESMKAFRFLDGYSFAR